MTKVPKIRRNKGQRGKENKEIGCVKLELGLEKNVCAFRNHVQLSILRYYYSVNLGPIYFFFSLLFFSSSCFFMRSYFFVIDGCCFVRFFVADDVLTCLVSLVNIGPCGCVELSWVELSCPKRVNTDPMRGQLLVESKTEKRTCEKLPNSIEMLEAEFYYSCIIYRRRLYNWTVSSVVKC